MPHTNEKAFNPLLASALAARHPRWGVHAEQKGALSDDSLKEPDIVILPLGGGAGGALVLETEYEPARSVDDDAKARLGKTLGRTNQTVDQVVAVTIPKRLGELSVTDILREIAWAKFSYRLWRLPAAVRPSAHSPDHEAPSAVATQAHRPVCFPEHGWVNGTVDDLAGFCERIALNEHLLEKSVTDLENTVNGVARMLRDNLGPWRRGALESIARALHQADDMQTTRMGVAILANAMLFQSAVAGAANTEISAAVSSVRPGDSRFDVLVAWGRILDVDYWPIFAVARDVLEAIPEAEAMWAIRSLAEMTSRLAHYGVTSTGDMAGQMFGRLIADRKFLATFYTRPASAHLLAELAVTRLDSAVEWDDPERVTALRVTDLACGTGTLLTAAYQRIAARVRRAGGDDKQIHAEMMKKALVGADIMPAAVHLTATLLSSSHPDVAFDHTAVFLMPYGSVTEGDEGVKSVDVEIGSLELLDPHFKQAGVPGLGMRRSSQATGGRGDREEESVLDHGAADLVIMNPPFTRPTTHETAEQRGVPVPSFAGFATSEDEQRKMSARLKKLVSGLKRPAAVKNGLAAPPVVASHGNAGMASNFLDLAHAKVKSGGVIAFVLPFTAVSGRDWSNARTLLQQHYSRVCVVAIADTGAVDRSFSADTGMAEVLVIATRTRPGERPEPDRDGVHWVNLLERPANPVEAVEIARSLRAVTSKTLARWSWASAQVGETIVGTCIRAGIRDGGCAGITEPDLAACAGSLAEGCLSLSRCGEVSDIPTVQLGELGMRGLYHLDIRGWHSDRTTPRGPFDIADITDWRAATWPMLWAHDAGRESRLVVEPDRQGRVRQGCLDMARRVWRTASRLHFNSDFRINSQPLAACLTPEPCIGGRAWPTFKLHDERWVPVALLWANTTLGLIGFWWAGTRQHQGRTSLTVTRLPELATLDPRALTDSQLDIAAAILESFEPREFLPANQAYQDETRQDLDRAVLVDLLGFDSAEVMLSLSMLRNQWCREPSVHGGKSTRPA